MFGSEPIPARTATLVSVGVTATVLMIWAATRSLDLNTSKHNISAYSKAAEAIGIVLYPIEAATPEAIDGAFSAAAVEGCGGAIVKRVDARKWGTAGWASAMAHRIPALSIWAEKVRFGMLLSYGQDVFEILVKTAGYVDKILKGAKPDDLPVEQPTRLKLVVNLKVAKALGLNIPPTLLASADDVIEWGALLGCMSP